MIYVNPNGSPMGQYLVCTYASLMSQRISKFGDDVVGFFLCLPILSARDKDDNLVTDNKAIADVRIHFRHGAAPGESR